MNIEKIDESIKALKKENLTIPVAFRLTVDEYVDVQHYTELFGFKTTSAFLNAIVTSYIMEHKEWERKKESQHGA